MKYRAKTKEVEAYRVAFGGPNLPSWLEGHVTVREGDNEEAKLKEGDVIVSDGGTVSVLSSEEFGKRFEQVRKTRKDAGSPRS